MISQKAKLKNSLRSLMRVLLRLCSRLIYAHHEALRQLSSRNSIKACARTATDIQLDFFVATGREISGQISIIVIVK